MITKKVLVCTGVFFIMVFISLVFSETRYVESNLRPALKHGEMWNYTANATAWRFDFPEGVGVYHNLSNLSAGHLDGFTFTGVDSAEGGSYLTAQYSGVYLVNWGISTSSIDNRDLYGFMVARNFDKDTARECYARRDLTSKTKVGSASSTCILDFNVGDTVNLLIENEVDNDGLNIHTVNMNLVRLDRL